MNITKKNFSDQLDNITKDLDECCFVGFDAEFTALLTGELFQYRLFDTNEERYNRLKTEVGNIIMSQIGLTMFKYDRDQDSYIATGYTFHLCPQSVGNIDQSLIFQASTLKFLCKHNFNFNKFIYEGLPYMSKTEGAKLRQQIKNETLAGVLASCLEIAEERQLQDFSSQVYKWLVDNEDWTMYLDVECPILRYLTHLEIRRRFPNVLTADSLGNSKKIVIYKNEHVEGATYAPTATLEDNLMNHLLGFSKIIYLLEASKKPIIGHNMFMDMVLLHNQFIGPMPDKYVTFKKNIHKMFPNIYDTKYISNELYTKINSGNSRSDMWKSTVLQDLYEFFSDGKCKRLCFNIIKLSRPFDEKQTYHEAGWDSYCSGFCFIRLGHWAACENRGSNKLVGPTETLGVLGSFANKVNVIRCAVPFMNLADTDPPKHRPQLLHVRSLASKTIDLGQMATFFGVYGSIDVKRHGRRSALIATGSNSVLEKIMRNLKDNKEYKISKYNKYKHTIVGKMTVWGGALLSGTMLFYFINRKVKFLSL